MDNHNRLQSQTLMFMNTVPAVSHYYKLLFTVSINQRVTYQHITFMLIILFDMLGKY